MVVCSLNGSRTIAACLEGLERQTIRDRAEVVVVDDGSTDGTSELARRFDVELVRHRQNLGISAARNTGIATVRAPLVAFTDDDCVPDPGWLEALLGAFERKEAAGVGGPVEVARTRTLVDRYLADHPPLAPLELALDRHRSLAGRIVIYLTTMWSCPRTGAGRYVHSLAGANMSFRASALESVGRFDPRMTFGADDEHVCEAIRDRLGARVLWFEPAAVVRHDYEGTVRDLLRRSYAYGSGHARAFLDEPSRRWPIVFPFPIALALGLVVARRGSRPVVLLLAHLLLPQGIKGALRHRRLDALAYTWLRLAEETAHNAGMLVGLLGALSGRSPRSQPVDSRVDGAGDPPVRS